MESKINLCKILKNFPNFPSLNEKCLTQLSVYGDRKMPGNADTFLMTTKWFDNALMLQSTSIPNHQLVLNRFSC